MKRRKIKTFKQNWNEVDETCPCCGQVIKVNRGLSKQNMMKLFKKPTIQDWIIFILLVLALYGAWAYENEVQQYKEIIKHPQELCQVYYKSILHENFYNLDSSDIPNINLIEDNEIE